MALITFAHHKLSVIQFYFNRIMVWQCHVENNWIKISKFEYSQECEIDNVFVRSMVDVRVKG